MKIKILIGILILLIAVNLGTLGSYLYVQFFQKKPGPEWVPSPRPPLSPRDRFERHLDRNQRHQLRNLLGEIYRESMPLREQLREVEREILQLMQQDADPMPKIDEKLQQMADLRLGIIRIAISKMQKAKSFLTPEQQEYFFNAIMMARPGISEPPDHMPPGPHRPEFNRNRRPFDSLRKGEKND